MPFHLLNSLIATQLKRKVDIMKLELTLHTIICGRTRKNIRLIESASKSAIYFPPPFPKVYGYVPPGSHRRGEDEVYITGENQDCINQAKKKLHELVTDTKCYVKDVMVSPHKIDSILLDRLDKVRKVMEANGTYVLFPQLGSQRGLIRVQGTDILHVERTVREIMGLVSSVQSSKEFKQYTKPIPGRAVLWSLMVAIVTRSSPSQYNASTLSSGHPTYALRYMHQFGCRRRI